MKEPMKLRQELDNLILLPDYQTPPAITPCWEWIAEAFKKTASNRVVLQDITIEIYGDYYEIKVDDEIVYEGDFPFSSDEVDNCVEIAKYNYINLYENVTDHSILFVYQAI